MKNPTKNWIKTTLSKFPFVEFDRYIDDTDDKLIEVFGWIKRNDIEGMKQKVSHGCGICALCHNEDVCIDRRQADSYNQALEDVREKLRKDFIVLEFDFSTKDVYCIATSSAKYSKQISKILGEKHISCKKINGLK